MEQWLSAPAVTGLESWNPVQQESDSGCQYFSKRLKAAPRMQWIFFISNLSWFQTSKTLSEFSTSFTHSIKHNFTAHVVFQKSRTPDVSMHGTQQKSPGGGKKSKLHTVAPQSMGKKNITANTEKIITHSVLELNFFTHTAKCFLIRIELGISENQGMQRLKKEFVGTAVLQSECDAENLGPIRRVCAPGPESCVKSVALHCPRSEAWILRGSAKNNY